MMQRPMLPDEYVDETQHLSGSVKGLVHYINNTTGRVGAYRINDNDTVGWFTWNPGLQGKDLFV